MGTDMYARVFNKNTKEEIKTKIPDFFEARNYTLYTLICGIRKNISNYTQLTNYEKNTIPDWIEPNENDSSFVVSIQDLKSFNWMQRVTHTHWITKDEADWCKLWNETPRSWCRSASNEQDYVKDYQWTDYGVSFEWVQQLHYWLDTLTDFRTRDEDILVLMEFD